MKFSRFILLSFASVLAILGSATAVAATVTWVGTSGGGDGTSWNSAANWGGTVPGVNDDAVIPVVADNLTIKITTAVSVKSLDCSEPLTMSAGSLTLFAPSAISEAFTVINATLTGAAHLCMSQVCLRTPYSTDHDPSINNCIHE